MASSSGAALNSSITATRNNTGAVCNSRLLAWSEAKDSYTSNNRVWVTDIATTNYTRTAWQSLEYNCTQMCGTICYAGPTTLHSSMESVYSTSTRTWQSWRNYPVPAPNCTIGFDDCLGLWTSHNLEWTSFWNLPSASRETTTMPEAPQCSACVSTACTFGYIGMSLYYWPPTTSASRDYCAWEPVGGRATTNLPNPNSSYTEVRTGPYAVVDGITMYEGNVYLSLDEPYVRDNCGTRIPRAKPGNNIITLASTDLYSVRKYPHNLIPWSVNYDDFNYPVPWSAYYGGRYCANNRPACSEVFNDDYHPVMVMPHEMRFLDKNWETCLYDQYGIFDPPIALKSVGNPFASTPIPSATTTVADPSPIVTPPTPGQPPNNGNPGPTGSPDPPNDPPGENDPQDPPGNNNPNPNPNPNNPQDPPNANPNNPQNPPNNNPSPNNPQDPPAPGSNPTNGSPRPTGPSNSGPGSPSPPRVTLGPSVVPVNPGGGVVLDPGTTLSPGAPPAVISGTTFSMGNGGLTIISPTTSTQVPLGNGPVTVPMGPGNAPITLDPAGTVVLGGTTLRPGGPAVTVNGSTLSIGPSGIVVVDPSGSTSTIAMPAGSPQVLTVGSSTFTAVGGDLTIAPGTTLRFGDDPVTVSGTTYSIGPSGLVVISADGTSTVPISMATQVLTVGSKTYTLYDGDLVLGPGTTIGVGDPAVTIDGTTYSVGTSGVVVLSDGGGTTVPVTGTETGAASGPTGAVEGAAMAVRWEWTWVVGLASALAVWNLV